MGSQIYRPIQEGPEKVQNKQKKIESLMRILTLLKETGSVPDEFYPHMLKGDYSGFMECHVENDFLLIWIDEESNQIRLTRLGSHSELFK